jgi:hypothetical protein
MSTTNELNTSVEKPEKSVAELFRSVWNHSQTSFGGSSHEDGNVCDVGAVYDYSQAVRDYKPSPLVSVSNQRLFVNLTGFIAG